MCSVLLPESCGLSLAPSALITEILQSPIHFRLLHTASKSFNGIIHCQLYHNVIKMQYFHTVKSDISTVFSPISVLFSYHLTQHPPIIIMFLKYNKGESYA